MLKIKDNIDLKELEKFGFEENNDSYYKSLDTWDDICLIINKKTRQIELNIYNKYDIVINLAEELTIIYDLIKADMVEKV